MIGLGVRCLRHRLPEILEDAETRLQADFRILLMGLRDDLVYLDERIKTEDKPSRRWRATTQRPTSAATARRRSAGGHGADRGPGGWAAIHAWPPGLGLGRAGPGSAQQRGQADLAGHQQTGDTYLRTLLIHGARAAASGPRQDGTH